MCVKDSGHVNWKATGFVGSAVRQSNKKKRSGEVTTQKQQQKEKKKCKKKIQPSTASPTFQTAGNISNTDGTASNDWKVGAFL